MPYKTEHRRKFDDLHYYLQENNRNEITRKANGGNSLLFTYPPAEEDQYLKKTKSELKGKAVFINISEVFVSFMEEVGFDDLKSMYKEFGVKVFHDDEEGSVDISLLNMIIEKIEVEGNGDYIPVLTSVGALHGTGITNVDIVEHEKIMVLKNPLVVLYPSTIEGDRLMFLGIKAASKYRSHIID